MKIKDVPQTGKLGLTVTWPGRNGLIRRTLVTPRNPRSGAQQVIRQNLATQAAAILLTQLTGWLAIFLAGYTLVLWPAQGRSVTSALADAGSSIFTLGFAIPSSRRKSRNCS